MGPKRQRGESSRAAQSYDKHRFVSKEASEKFDDVMARKTIIPERGLKPGSLDGSLVNMITEWNWGIFTNAPEPACESIVREFYANASEKKNVVRIRGKNVSFGAAEINDFYNLEDEQDVDGYTTYRTESLNLNEVIRGLCQPDAEWVIKDGEPRFFSHRFLSRYGKAWYYFICAKLLPTTHVSDVIRSRAVLLYCMVNGMSVNVGRVILGSIKSTIHGGTAGGLPHPSLICGLCERAGVVWDESEPMQQPKITIDSRLISHYNQWDGAPANPRGAGFVMEAQSPSEEEFMAEDPQPEADMPQPSLGSLAAELRQLRRDSRRQARHIDYVAQQVNSMAQFNASFTTTLAQMFERAGLNNGPNPLHFPEPPVIPDFPPPSPEDEDNA